MPTPMSITTGFIKILKLESFAFYEHLRFFQVTGDVSSTRQLLKSEFNSRSSNTTYTHSMSSLSTNLKKWSSKYCVTWMTAYFPVKLI